MLFSSVSHEKMRQFNNLFVKLWMEKEEICFFDAASGNGNEIFYVTFCVKNAEIAKSCGRKKKDVLEVIYILGRRKD